METLLASFVIPLDPKTKKNSHRIAGRGARCPKCGKPRQQFIRNGGSTTAYSLACASYLYPKPPQPFTGPVRLVYRLYTATRRRVDDLNLYEALDDILVTCKVLSDDNRSVIRSRDGSRVLYDKDRPRAEIYIYDYDEEADPYGSQAADVHR